MEFEIAADAPLDYVTFRILPENRSDLFDSCFEFNCYVLLKISWIDRKVGAYAELGFFN